MAARALRLQAAVGRRRCVVRPWTLGTIDKLQIEIDFTPCVLATALDYLMVI